MIEKPDTERLDIQKHPWVRALDLSLYLILGFSLVTFAAMNNFFVSRCGGHPGAKKNACIANLKQMDGAKRTWALEYKIPSGRQPTDLALFGTNRYMRLKPSCPSGGEYSTKSIGEKPLCSISGHTI
jgi:hypothetical protein